VGGENPVREPQFVDQDEVFLDMSGCVFGGIPRVEHRIEATAVILIRMRQDEDVDVRDLAVELLAELQQMRVYVVAAGFVFVAGLGRRVAIDDDLGVVAERDQRAVAIADWEISDPGVHFSFSQFVREIKLAVEQVVVPSQLVVPGDCRKPRATDFFLRIDAVCR
jgi:hypothetical protein